MFAANAAVLKSGKKQKMMTAQGVLYGLYWGFLFPLQDSFFTLSGKK